MTHRIGRVAWLDTLAFKKEAHRADCLALTLTECRHQLLKLGAALNLEEDLIVVVGNFDVEVLGVAARCWRLVLGRGAVLWVVRHLGGERRMVCFGSGVRGFDFLLSERFLD